jgi:hypothetical protein
MQMLPEMENRLEISSETLGWISNAPAGNQPRAGLVGGTHSSVVEDFHQRFQLATGKHHSAERFDATAAQLYFEADDPGVLGDQEQAIRRLLKRRRETTSSPNVMSYEEQDPRFGKWTTALLTLGCHGDLKFINNSYIHLNSPPKTRPPPVIDVHLCWGTRFGGASNASTLHGVAALLMDDSRDALANVNVSFHAHRLGPGPASRSIGGSGRRWRRRAPDQLPPASMVGLFFVRANQARALAPLVFASATPLRHHGGVPACSKLICRHSVSL